jgi:hypothetical protein
MKSQNKNHDPRYAEALEAAEQCQRLTMDLIELEFLDSPKWDYLRPRLLRIFGDRGLRSRLHAIFESEDLERS